MKKTATLLAAAIVSVVAGLGIATDSNARSAAQSSMSDQTYCQLLADFNRASDEKNVDATVPEAINQCDKGNTAASIPVLEKALTIRSRCRRASDTPYWRGRTTLPNVPATATKSRQFSTSSDPKGSLASLAGAGRNRAFPANSERLLK
jgi:hypothetical protein